MEKALLPATRRNIILDAADKQLNKDPRNQATDKSYPQPEHVFLKASKPNYKNAQKTHHGGKKGFQCHSPVTGGRANLGVWLTSHGRCSFPMRKIVGSTARQVNGVLWSRTDPQLTQSDFDN
jgi:hypothetical protein